jgi:hypothetical protein
LLLKISAVLAHPAGLALYAGDVVDGVVGQTDARVELVALGIRKVTDAAVNVDICRCFSAHNYSP